MRRIAWLAPLLIFGLAACSDLVPDLPNLSDAFTTTPVVCPSAAVLSQASLVTKFKPGGDQQPNNIALTAEMFPPKVDCDYASGAAVADIHVTIPVIVRGGASAGTAPLGYFVALVDADDNVVSRQEFSWTASAGAKAQVVYNEDVGDVPLSVAKGKKPENYRVIVGFNLTPQELAYNRESHRATP